MPEQQVRRRGSWAHRLLLTLLVLIVATTSYIFYKRSSYQNEIERLRSGMSDVERERADLLLATDEKRDQVMLELIRRQSLGDENLHLAVAVDSSEMHLQREGARLRTMHVEVGSARIMGSNRIDTIATALDSARLAIPRGSRTVEALLTATDSWEVPAFVYQARGEEPPADRRVKGALGPYAAVLSGGTIIYSHPTSGPLADSTYVLPASIRVGKDDMESVFPNLRVGMRVYFY
jgi:hypothetical protein